MQAKKDKGSPWMFNAVRGGKVKSLSEEDLELVEKYSFDLAEELKPLDVPAIKSLLGGANQAAAFSSSSSDEEGYSYGDDTSAADEPTFFSS